ncbi:hypothetical protein [Tenacibaculum crassostreae]|uniref:hypothetical protein n=1 Tax=Tenacibaculum crassostreae TaxID=502683 RepID=UPI0038962BAF
MTKIIFDSFKSTLQEVRFLNNILNKEKVSKAELIKGLNQAKDLLFSSYSSLSIFSEVIKNEVSIGYKIDFNDKKQKKNISKTEAKVIYNELLGIIKSELNEGVLKPKESLILENQISAMGLHLVSASIDEDFRNFNNNFNNEELTLKELSISLNNYVEVIVKYIEDILLYDVFIIFEKPDIVYTKEILFTTDYKKEYIDKWLNCTVTFNELRRNKRTDHWAEIYKLNLDFEHIEKIENHQKKLFNERIESEIRSALNDFDELDEDVKKEALNKEINLIQNFFNSDTSKTIVKRLKNILSFSKPKEVIIEYDNILRDRLLLSDFNIYTAGKSTYSSVFVASFFMSYLEALKESVDKTNKTTLNPRMTYTNYQNDEPVYLFIVEELEKRLAIEAVEYKRKLDDEWEKYTFDPMYFDNFISGNLYNEFLKSLYERIKPLNDFEINKYLTLSVNQFKTHTPEKRAEAFKRLYYGTYWFPNYMEYKEESYMSKYAMHVWKHYESHFNKYKEATENILQDFKNGLIGSGKKEIIEKPKTVSKSKYHSFTYINNLTGQSNLTALKESLITKGFIANDTDLKDFRKVFSGETIEKPIVWTGNISELYYFISQLHNKLKLVVNLKQKQWEVTTICFVQEDGSPFDRYKFKGQKAPTTSKNIDLALNTLK